MSFDLRAKIGFRKSAAEYSADGTGGALNGVRARQGERERIEFLIRESDSADPFRLISVRDSEETLVGTKRCLGWCGKPSIRNRSAYYFG